jgi:hypothetical protein
MFTTFSFFLQEARRLVEAVQVAAENEHFYEAKWLSKKAKGFFDQARDGMYSWARSTPVFKISDPFVCEHNKKFRYIEELHKEVQRSKLHISRPFAIWDREIG